MSAPSVRSRYKRPGVAITLPRGGDRLVGVAVRFKVQRRFHIGPKMEVCYLTTCDGIERKVGPIAMLDDL